MKLLKNIIDFWNNKVTPILIIAFFFIIIGFSAYKIFNLLVTSIVETRSHNLNLMQYDGKNDKFIPKDSITISNEELYYLQHGKFKK